MPPLPSRDQTNRKPQRIDGGLDAGAVATALLGMSPDGSKRAVFAVLTGDGALAQAHTERGMDGLARPGTIGAIRLPPPSNASGARDPRRDAVELGARTLFFDVEPRRLTTFAGRRTD